MSSHPPLAARPSRNRLPAALIVVVSGVALELGCGPGGTSFRIGVEGPLSGDQQSIGLGMVRGAQLAAQEINAAGGVLGKQVEVVGIDDAANPDTGVAAATKAIEAGLDAVVGPYNSGVGLKTLPLYEAAGLIPLRLTSSDQTAGRGFTLQPMTSQIAPVATTAISSWLKAKSVAIIYDQSEDYTKAAEAAMRQHLADAGVTITLSEPIAPGAASYAETVSKVAATNPDLVYIDTYYPEAGSIVKAMVAANVTASCLADYGAYDNGFITAAGTAAQKCPVVGVPAPSDFTNSAAHVEAFETKFSEPPNVWSPYTYDSVKLLAAKAAEARGFESKALKAALLATSGWKGWTGTVSFEASTGNRQPAPVTVNAVDAQGTFHVDDSWAKATGFTF